YEYGSLLEAALMVSSGRAGLDPDVERLVQAIDVPVHLEVMVTLTCPYCPRMVHLAHQLALASEHIRADMVESAEFPQLVQRYQVSGVPRTVVNEVHAFEGALPPADAVLEILKGVKPAAYERIEAQQREARGERHATAAQDDHTYDLLIIGAGPAGLAAAIYAMRKGLDVVLVGEHMGGQMTNTASVENWLGIPEISGQDLAGMFRDHAERYPIAERLGVKVHRVARQGDHFTADAGDHHYTAKAVVYCAGKQYRTLGVTGENRFLGRGIAFCATCDAPLYRDKTVAVVGGGNSAFTAVRDLLRFARHIHLVHMLADFQADPVLVDEIRQAPNVTFHLSTQVQEFLGSTDLTGVRLQSADGKRHFDLKVQGVFLEVGLVPNASPVEELVTLNEAGEIPVQCDQSTAVPGLFAAGDITDAPDKQMIIAAGAGAQAALAAARYLQGGKE
ncbi:MAG: FAD-dependent oxidoreductase, partial [Gammaproteobacteria bacterium]